MKHGYIDDQNRGYLITTPKIPVKGINYLKLVKVDGQEITGNIVPIFGESETHRVEVVMGEEVQER